MLEKHYFIPDRWVRKLPALRNIYWALEALMLHILLWVIRILPMQRGYNLCVFICRTIEPLTPFTAKFERNLRVAFPEKSAQEIRQLALKNCANIGKVLVELALAKRIWREREQRLEFVNHESGDSQLTIQHPTVFVTAHTGAWQLTNLISASDEVSVTSVYAPEPNPYLRKMVNRTRLDLHSRFIPKKGCMRELTMTLKRGGLVGFAADLRLDSGEQLPLFGVNAPTNTTAARMAVHHGCDMVPVRAERLPDCRFRITMFPPIRADDPNASVNEQVKQMTQKQLTLFESWIRDTPDQWFCVGRRWEKDVYAREPGAQIVPDKLDLMNQ